MFLRACLRLFFSPKDLFVINVKGVYITNNFDNESGTEDFLFLSNSF